MSFERIPYMEWAKTHENAGFPTHIDLANSGMPCLPNSLKDLGIDPATLPLSGDNEYGYLPLKEAIAQRYKVRPENIFLAQGTSMSNFVLLATLLDPGDVILVETPVYECLSHPPAALGARVISFERRESEGWKLPVERIAELAKQNRAKAIFFANPNNPTGAFDSDDTITTLAEAVGEGCLLIVDEVYREWLEGEYGHTVALKRPNIITTTSLTKVWGLGSLRAGWTIGAEKLIHDAHRTYDHMGVDTPFLTEWIMGELFTHPERLQDLRDRGVESVTRSRAMIDKFLAGPGAGRITSLMAAGGGFSTWHLEGKKGRDIAESLMREQGVLLVSGHFFGLPDHFRVSWTRGEEQVREGLSRIEEWLNRR